MAAFQSGAAQQVHPLCLTNIPKGRVSSHIYRFWAKKLLCRQYFNANHAATRSAQSPIAMRPAPATGPLQAPGPPEAHLRHLGQHCRLRVWCHKCKTHSFLVEERMKDVCALWCIK